MHSIIINFASLTALAAAIPHLSATPGMLTGQGSFPVADQIPGNVAGPGATTAPTVPTVSAALTPVAAPAASQMNFGGASPVAPTFTFDQVGAALQAYHAKDVAAFGAAMQKFGFASMTDVQANPAKWGELMVYIGAVQPAAPAVALTLEKVASVLQTWSQVNAASFQAAMVANGLASMPDVQANPAKWPALMAAANAVGIS